MTGRDIPNESLGATRDKSSAPTGLDDRSQREVLFERALVLFGFADQGTVDDVLRQSKADPQKPFAEIMVRHGVITGEERQLIERLIERQNPRQGSPTVSLNQSLVSTTIAYVPRHDDCLRADQRFGDYELLEEIARGGMGVVYKARQTKLGRLVALKMILSGEFSDAAQVNRFHAEAEAAATLDHPGIVPVYEAGQVGGRHFFSMAFVSGKSLSDLVKADGPLAPKQAARIMKSATDAVQYAHDKGIVHRDIKPGNILLDEYQQPRVTDFGLAKRVEGASELTATGQVMGTPSYMPPEQAAGKTNEIGPVADVYSLGATLYFLLVGRPPFQSPSQIETVRQVIDTEPVSLRRLDPSIPRDLETICLKCLRKEIDKRYSSAAALADDLGNWLDNKPIVARRVSRREKAWLWCKRRPAIAGLLAVLFIVIVAGSFLFNERQNASYASGLVDSLVKADVEQVSGLVKEMSRYRRWTDPLLRQRFAAARDGSVEQLFLRLALLPVDTSHAAKIQEEFLVRETRYLGAIRDGLQSHQGQFIDMLWEICHDKQQSADRRFRAGLALASYATASDQWTAEDHGFLAEQLVGANSEHQPRLREYLRPIQDKLLPDLNRIFADAKSPDAERLSAANAFADYAAADIPKLSRLLVDATPKQYEVLYPIVAANPSPATIEDLSQIAATLPPVELGSEERVPYGQRRANSAVTLLRLGERGKVLPVFEMTDDPEALTQFVFRCRPRGVGVEALLDCLQRVNDAPRDRFPRDTRYALLLALGEFKLAEIPESRREALLQQLADWYRHDPSSGVHGAAGWLLRKWGVERDVVKVEQTPVPYDATGQRDWFTLGIQCRTPGPFGLGSAEETLYFTFIVFPPGEYSVGSPESETDRNSNEKLHRVKLTRPVAVSDRELNWRQYNAFDNRSWHEGMERQWGRKLADEDPAFGINWYEAVTYCRWLTAQAELGESTQCYDDPARLPKDPAGNPQYNRIDLQRGGFRLLTEAEWEVVCRSGTQTAYSFGNDVQLLGEYGWFQDTSHKWSHSVGQLRPNLRGLFDLHGNLFERCHDRYAYYAAEAEDPSGPSRGSSRLNRGGSFNYDAAICRSAYRLFNDPTFRSGDYGFRLALSPSGVSPEAGRGPGAEPAGAGTEGATAEQRPELP